MPQSGPVFTFALVFGCLLGGHALVLAGFAVLRGRWGSASRRRRGALLASTRYAAEFVGTEALMLTGALELGVIRLSRFSLTGTLVTLFTGFVAWEIWFYVGHRLLHTRLLYPLHRRHHAEEGLHASLCFTAGETMLLSSGYYVPLAIASHVGQAVSVTTLVLSFSIAHVLNVVSHLDFDLFGARFEASPFRHVLNSTRYHALHHAGRRGNYGLNAPWLDRLFGTEVAPRIAQDDVVDGTPSAP